MRRPGEVIGPILGPNGPGSELPLIAVGSHDTASAVAGVPAAEPSFAYISSGTWSLAGMELDAPVLTEAGRAANFTNEMGIDGTIRYLRNVTGLWLLQESLRTSPEASLGSLLDEAARRPPLRFVIDPDDPVFLPPGDMPGRIASGWPAAARPSRPSPPRPCAASLTAWRWPTGARSSRRSRPQRAARGRGAHRRRRACSPPLCQLHRRRHRAAGDRSAEATCFGNVLVQALAPWARRRAT